MCSSNSKKLCGDEKCVDCMKRSFVTSDKARFWSTKNKLLPYQVPKMSGKKFWFSCDKCLHDFETALYHIQDGVWCPYCATKKMCYDEICTFCHHNSMASSDKAKFWSKKNELPPRHIFKGSNKKIWFTCDLCHHDFESVIHRVRNQWCPYCSVPPKYLCPDEKCQTCFNRSFASSDKAKFWSNRNNKSPREIFKATASKYLFDCPDCDHTFEKALYSIKDGWCPFCANQKLCEDKDCEICFNKSMASSDRAKFWSKKNKVPPRKVFKSTNKSYWFDCDSCCHDFEKALNSVKSGKWCPYCSNQKLCENLQCEPCFHKSLASSERSKCWSSKNELGPRQLFKGSHKKYMFICDVCSKEFSIQLDHVQVGSWCQKCRYKTEKKLAEYLETIYHLTGQVRFDWCKNPRTGRMFVYDFLVNNVLIELDGPQHFHQISNWLPCEEQQERDVYKNRMAIYNGYSIIRISQENVFHDKKDWQHLLNIALCMAESAKSPIVLEIYGEVVKRVIYQTELLWKID